MSLHGVVLSLIARDAVLSSDTRRAYITRLGTWINGTKRLDLMNRREPTSHKKAFKCDSVLCFNPYLILNCASFYSLTYRAYIRVYILHCSTCQKPLEMHPRCCPSFKCLNDTNVEFINFNLLPHVDSMSLVINRFQCVDQSLVLLWSCTKTAMQYILSIFSWSYWYKQCGRLLIWNCRLSVYRSVCLSVCLSVMLLCTVALTAGLVWGLNVEFLAGRALPIHFSRHFLTQNTSIGNSSNRPNGTDRTKLLGDEIAIA